MPDGTDAAVVTAKPTTAPKSAAEYHAEAMALMGGGAAPAPAEPVAAEPAVPNPPPPGVKAEEPEQAKPEEGKAPEEEKPVEPPAPKGFDVVVREKAALRKEKLEFEKQRKEYEELKAAREIASTDPIAAMSKLGLTYEQVTRAALGLKRAEGGAKPEEKKDDPTLAAVKALEEKLAAQERRAQNAELRATLGTVTKAHADKLPLTTAMGMENQAVQYLQQYINETGEMPAATLEDSLRVSLEAIEANLELQAKAWEGVLTKTRKPATVGTQVAAPKPAVTSATSGQAKQPKSLTSSLTAPATPGADDEPQTDEDYRARALALLTSRGA